MNLKSVLCAATMLAAASVAQAFPDYTVYPKDGETLNSNELLQYVSIQNLGDGEIILKDGAYATLFNDEEAEEVEVDLTKVGMPEYGMPYEVKAPFDPAEILVNGTWKLTIEAGSFTVAGEENPEITATWTLNDPNLGLGEYPKIDLVSIDPAEGTKLAYWGGVDFSKVLIKTSDDDAVNYIEWTLYDVTDGGKEYLRQGNDNRYDFNRYKHHDDIWKDGLFIALTDDDATREKLIKGHTYSLELRFCGIGYDDATNQYPTPQQLNASTELETSVTYEGLIDPPVYSEATVVEVSPNPDEYEIETPEQAVFHIEYSAPVKPVAFTYPLGSGAGLASAGDWAPFEGMTEDANGLCTKWTFTISESALASAVGAITVNVQAQDNDGLYVQGNGDMIFDNYNYSMTWSCNVAAPALVSVSPLENSTVESLSSITVSNLKDDYLQVRVMTCYDGINTPARILTMEGEEVRILDRPTFSENGLEATFTFEPITEDGTYILEIPKLYFNIGEEMDAYFSNSAAFRYYVENGENPSNVTYDLLPTEIDPANDAVVESISNVKLTFGNVTFTPLENTPEGQLYKVVDGEDTLIESVVAIDNDFFNPTAYTYSFKEVTEDGQYKVVIPKATFYDSAYDESMGESGHASPEIVLNYTIGGGSSDMYDLMPMSISPADGETVSAIETVTVDFDQMVYPYVVLDENYQPIMLPADLYLITDDGEMWLQSANPSTNPEANNHEPDIYDFIFESVTTEGKYKVVIPQGALCDLDYYLSYAETGHANPEIVLYYTIGGGNTPSNASYTVEPVKITPANGETVKEIATVTVEFGEVVFPMQMIDGASVSLVPGVLYKVTESGDEELQSVDPFDNPLSDFFNPTIYDFNFSTVKENGNYKVVIPAGAFGDDPFIASEGTEGKANPEIVIFYAIGTVGVDAIFGSDAVINVYDVNGVQILKDANVEAAKELKSGLYIINGQKVMIRR